MITRERDINRRDIDMIMRKCEHDQTDRYRINGDRK